MHNSWHKTILIKYFSIRSLRLKICVTHEYQCHKQQLNSLSNKKTLRMKIYTQSIINCKIIDESIGKHLKIH